MSQKQGLIRNTNQRQLILEFIERSLTHPTAEQVFQSVRKKLPRISFGTIYRNLDVLEKQGSITGLKYSKEHVRYHAGSDDHYHFVCEHCDKIDDLEMNEMLDLNSQVAKRHGLIINKHSLFFYGLCEDCKKYLEK